MRILLCVVVKMGVSLENYKSWLLRGVDSVTAKLKRLFVSDGLGELSEHLRKLSLERRKTMFQASPSLDESSFWSCRAPSGGSGTHKSVVSTVIHFRGG